MLEPGEIFAGYVIERELGRGGMGAVYLARHPRLPRWIALKLLNSEYHGDTETHARFVREADLAARLNHPGVVTVYDRGVEHGRLWIAMQYVDGVEAEAVTDMSPERAVAIVTATADALDYAHRVGVLHRDVKPANILLARETREQQAGVLLTDFGIARLQEETGRLTGSGSVMATLAYAAPEQLRNQPVDHRSDQYALACTLFRLLTGVTLFPAADLGAIVKSHLYDSPPPVGRIRPGLPASLDPVLARALAKNPDDRYLSCTEFAVAARRALEAGTATAARPGPREKIPEMPVRRANSPAVRRTGNSAPGSRVPTSETPVPRRASQSSVAVRSGRLVDIPDLFGPRTERHLEASSGDTESPRTERHWPAKTRTVVLLGACLAAALGLAAFLFTPSGNTEKPKAPAAEIAEISANFPGLVPRTPELGAGFAAASCRVVDHDTKDFLPPWAFEGWSAAWDCQYSADHDVREYVLFAYGSGAAARSVANRIHPAGSASENLSFKESCGAKQYTNLRFDASPDTPSTIFATTFFDDPAREKFLLYTRGTPTTPSGVLDWWKSLPLTRS
ncbi:serine/threonine-protein kinase [Nocardia aurantiaca]|uniref:non-specific serine/threonine protein kinase n=1 Tax=Nocardia aurantiaca TaxID=2675850 RepID=A0A6I3KRQ2_9NOCA|nr:protein kinase [Nocardia aurantiaca]